MISLNPRRICRFVAVLLLATSFIVSPGQHVQAIDGGVCDYNFFEDNAIDLYDPCDTGCPTTTSTAGQLTGTDNEQKIYNFWISQGLSPTQAAGITGSIQGENSEFNPFEQQIDPTTSQPYTWPTKGYGITQFSDGQRVAVTTGDPTNNLASLGDMYTTYYTASYSGIGGNTSIPSPVNDAFLSAELNYLSGYVSKNIPSDTAIAQLQTDYGLSMPANTKLLSYIKTLSSQDSVAEAWTYLYEPLGSDTKTTAATQAGYADIILIEPWANAQATADCSSIGTGGLTFDQADKLMIDYEKNAASWFLAHGFGDKSGKSQYQYGPSTGGQCTVLVTYFEDRFSKPLPNIYDGPTMAKSIVSHSGGVYSLGDSKSIKPYSIVSFTPAHTSIILGVNSDGSIIVDEMWRGTSPVATQRKEHDNGSAIGRVEVWSSIDTYLKGHGTVTGIAIPSNDEINHINSQLGPYLAGLP